MNNSAQNNEGVNNVRQSAAEEAFGDTVGDLPPAVQ